MGSDTYVFIDIDGTLVNSEKVVPVSARDACVRARANGIKLVLSTGRSLPELLPSLVAIGFDGIVSASGGAVSWGSEQLFESPIPPERTHELFEYFRANGFEFLWQASRGVWGDPGLLEELHQAVRPDVAGLPEGWRVFRDPEEEIDDVLKCLFKAPSPDRAQEFREAFDDRLTIVDGSLDAKHPSNGEITAAGVSKGTAVRELRRHLGVPNARFIGIGDSENDAEMLREADYAIAMGNATPLIKGLADMETDSVDEDGFAHAFERAGLI
ncbi:MAG: HAD family hydrolase [Bifidobacteriaceae bacterium]|jgi:Cof subfamily protein (haloacid dehalogenase superfamily)|nr:HAD family hydrolase [Bifidobacteriaceae bacterium]